MPILDRFPRATLHLGRGRPPRLCHIRLQGSAATIGAPAILLEDSRPKAILKLHRTSSLDYRASHGLSVLILCITMPKICRPHFNSTRAQTRSRRLLSHLICLVRPCFSLPSSACHSFTPCSGLIVHKYLAAAVQNKSTAIIILP